MSSSDPATYTVICFPSRSTFTIAMIRRDPRDRRSRLGARLTTGDWRLTTGDWRLPTRGTRGRSRSLLEPVREAPCSSHQQATPHLYRGSECPFRRRGSADERGCGVETECWSARQESETPAARRPT